jgi:uncharacterized protein (TIGR03790 family)
MSTDWRRPASILLFCALAARLWAGGSGLNVVVVVNSNSAASVQLGNYYCEKRQVPPQNLLRTSWTGGNIAWQKSDFQSVILTPLLAMLSARQLTNQVDYVLLCTDFPYRVMDTTNANSTTTPLFYGFVPDDPPPSPGEAASCSLPNASFNAYSGSELPFRSVPPGTSKTNFLAVMLTSSNLAEAKLVVDRGVASDSTLFSQTVYLGKSDDLRNARYVLFDNAIFNTRVRGNYSMQRTNVNSPNGLGYIGGYENGYQTGIPAPIFAPGALADQLTSFGGELYEQIDHTTALQYLNAGAAGSYGTITEPCLYLAKFPSPQAYFYQARGFTMAECYYQSVTNPYQGLLLGEPLAAPFALPPTGAWTNLPPDALLAGTTNLSGQFLAPDANHPVQQVDLFVDGTFAQTLTNIPPSQSNILIVTIRGRLMSYAVPVGATLQSVAAGLAAVLNTNSNTNVTKVRAFTRGDRIELQSFDATQPGPQVSISAGSAVGNASALTTFVAASRASFLDSIAFGRRTFTVYYAPSADSYLLLTVTKTNGSVVTVGATNSAGNTSITALVQTLVNLVKATPALQGSDGVTAEGVVNYDGNQLPSAQFNLRPLSPGWGAAQLQAGLSASAPHVVQPATSQKLDPNVADLQPRNHLYVTAGLPNLPFTFPFNTATLADGYHELTAVAYEGSHVRTQKRLAQTVRIRNSPLAATFATLVGGSNTLLGVTLQFSVGANTNNITKIELFSTGGSLASVLNQTNATFSVPGANLGVGLHPFYAVITAANGRQYRTETQWVRLVDTPPPVALSLIRPAPVLTWPATPGRAYDILTATDLTNAFQLSATVTAANSVARWTDTDPAGPRRFYRVRASAGQAPFRVSLTPPAPVLTWPATAGQRYEILTATDPRNVFQLSASLTPSNSAVQWTDTNAAVPQRFYRVRAVN